VTWAHRCGAAAVVARWGLPPLRFQLSVGRVADVSDETSATDTADTRDTADTDTVAAAERAMHDARERLLGVPAEVVVTNHVMGLYELAAIHLSADPPNPASAALAIDAVACLVEGLGDRLGDDAATMRDALANIRLAFVQITSSHDTPSG